MAEKTPKIYRSPIAAAMHETVEGLHEIGIVNKRTMRQFDESCLAPVLALLPDEIRAIRDKEAVSQQVFARYLNVSKNLISDWERGAKRPGGPALCLLNVIRRNGLQAIA